MNEKIFFITGTDTDVGKTFIGEKLAKSLFDKGVRLAPRKPAESGCIEIDGELLGADAKAYFEACAQTIPLATINPLRYRAALAPPAAAQAEGQALKLDRVLKAVAWDPNEVLLVEGAGGWLSPLAEDASNADLAVSIGAKVIIVAANKLGCLNHIMLTIEAIECRGLQVAAMVLNQIGDDTSGASNLSWLEQHLTCPLIHYAGDTAQKADALSLLGTLLVPESPAMDTC